MRIIAEQYAFAQWSAWWEDEPGYCVCAPSRFGAVAKLLKRSNHQAIAVENLCIDMQASRSDHVEMV
jgi:hypothetical protein